MTTDLQNWTETLTSAIDGLRDPFAPINRLPMLPPVSPDGPERLKALAGAWLAVCGPHSVSDIVRTIGNRFGEHHAYLSDLNALEQRLRSLETEIAGLLEQHPADGVAAELIPTSTKVVAAQGWLADTGIGDAHGNPVRFVTIQAPSWLKKAMPPDTLIGGTMVVGPTEWRPIAGTWIRPFYSLTSALSLTRQQAAIEAEREERARRQLAYDRQAAIDRDRRASVPARAADLDELRRENEQLRARLAQQPSK